MEHDMNVISNLYLHTDLMKYEIEHRLIIVAWREESHDMEIMIDQIDFMMKQEKKYNPKGK